MHNELKTKLELVSEVDSSHQSVLPSEINPSAPGLADPLHIPMSTVIRVLQQKEQKEMDKALNISSPNGTLGRTSPQESTDKLMISHGKRNFTIKGTKNVTNNIKQKVPTFNNNSENLLAGTGKMSSNLTKLINEDQQARVEPVFKTEVEVPRMNSPEAAEISNSLQRILFRERTPEKSENVVVVTQKVHHVTTTLPKNHKISDQLKKLILEDIKPEKEQINGHSNTSLNTSQSSSVNSIPEAQMPPRAYIAVCPKPPTPKTSTLSPNPMKFRNGHQTLPKQYTLKSPKPPVSAMSPLKSPLSPKTHCPVNGNLIDNSIRLPLPPRVPSPPPPEENPKRLNSQLSCDRLNLEFQEFNAYRSATLPSPKKLAIAFDPNGPPNFEKKTVVSFAHDLAVTPNRFPDVVKVTRIVENGGYQSKEQQQLQNVKFIIDPSNDEVVQVTV